jgi:hypothetical protein
VPLPGASMFQRSLSRDAVIVSWEPQHDCGSGNTKRNRSERKRRRSAGITAVMDATSCSVKRLVGMAGFEPTTP